MEVLPPGSGPQSNPAFEVGDFPAGSSASRWALSRYLLGRALAVQVSRALLAVALLVAAVAVALYLGGLTVLAVLIGLVAIAILGARAVLGAILRRLTLTSLDADAERRLARLVADTRKDVAAELRRIGVPSRSLTLPLLAVQLAGRRRSATLARLRAFDAERVVPAGRLDDLHLLIDPRARRGGSVR